MVVDGGAGRRQRLRVPRRSASCAACGADPHGRRASGDWARGRAANGREDRGPRRPADAPRSHRAGAPPRSEAPALSRLSPALPIRRKFSCLARRGRCGRSATRWTFPTTTSSPRRIAKRSWRRRSSRSLVPITTEKDRVRLNRRGAAAARLAAATETFPVRVRFDEPKRLDDADPRRGRRARQRLPAGAAHFARRRESSRLSDAAASTYASCRSTLQ